jgi:hypothetical protein
MYMLSYYPTSPVRFTVCRERCSTTPAKFRLSTYESNSEFKNHKNDTVLINPYLSLDLESVHVMSGFRNSFQDYRLFSEQFYESYAKMGSDVRKSI